MCLKINTYAQKAIKIFLMASAFYNYSEFFICFLFPPPRHALSETTYFVAFVIITIFLNDGSCRYYYKTKRSRPCTATVRTYIRTGVVVAVIKYEWFISRSRCRTTITERTEAKGTIIIIMSYFFFHPISSWRTHPSSPSRVYIDHIALDRPQPSILVSVDSWASVCLHRYR